MPYHLLPVPVIVVVIVLYWQARQQNQLKRVAVLQPLGSALITLVALLSLLSPNANPTFTTWVLVGLILSVIGDVNNVDMEDERTVFVGLIIFVLAYLAYAFGLTLVNGYQRPDIVSGVILLVTYGAVLRYLWPGLGDMRIPVALYALVMPYLVWRAVSTFFGDAFNPLQAVLLTAGAVALYVGDLEYGIHRFRRPELRTTFGPVLYLGGQLLIALSLAYF
jgi:uncharacterized membrane protein YhhN